MRIGLVYIDDPNWTGGSDYVINLINALNYLPSNEQPEIVLFLSRNTVITDLKKKIEYPRYCIHQMLQARKALIMSRIFRFFGIGIYKKPFDFIYPMPKNSSAERYFSFIPLDRRIFWIPDFQEKYFPHLFGEEICEKRNKTRSELTAQPENTIVLSSDDAKHDLLKFYPNNKAKLKVLRFANTSKWAFSKVDRRALLAKYQLPDKYFICPNQFWKHKNHMLVIQAVKHIVDSGGNVCVAFCGKELDPRAPNHVPQLKQYVSQNGLGDSIRFLGFLDKADQMALLHFSTAMIQPSFFEGWSTTIEDGIALKKLVIASNLGVNQEQLQNLGLYFDPHKSEELAQLLENNTKRKEIEYQQNNRVQKFAKTFVNLMGE
jgi:glycosyltransferase involved in cell wall biosynthesis